MKISQNNQQLFILLLGYAWLHMCYNVQDKKIKQWTLQLAALFVCFQIVLKAGLSGKKWNAVWNKQSSDTAQSTKTFLLKML